MVPTDPNPASAASHECFAPMCELLHTVSANQTCSSVESLFWGGPARAECTETADNWCFRAFIEVRRVLIYAQIGGPLSGQTPLRCPRVGRARPPRFRTIQVSSDQFMSAPWPCPSARWQAEPAADPPRGAGC